MSKVKYQPCTEKETRTMATQHIKGAYIDGIKEGRSFLNNNPDLTLAEMKRCKKNAHELMKKHSHEMKDSFKGERDFWAQQIKKG